MPLIRKKRIWWEPVPEATGYVVYVCKDSSRIDPAKFSWETTTGVISKPVIWKTELIIPDEWPEFPGEPGTYHIAITSKDEIGNQSDPLLLSGLFQFVAPPPPLQGGIEKFPWVDRESGPLPHSLKRQGRAIIQRGLEEVRDAKEVEDIYLGGD